MRVVKFSTCSMLNIPMWVWVESVYFVCKRIVFVFLARLHSTLKSPNYIFKWNSYRTIECHLTCFEIAFEFPSRDVCITIFVYIFTTRLERIFRQMVPSHFIARSLYLIFLIQIYHTQQTCKTFYGIKSLWS